MAVAKRIALRGAGGASTGSLEKGVHPVAITMKRCSGGTGPISNSFRGRSLPDYRICFLDKMTVRREQRNSRSQ